MIFKFYYSFYICQLSFCAEESLPSPLFLKCPHVLTHSSYSQLGQMACSCFGRSNCPVWLVGPSAGQLLPPSTPTPPSVCSLWLSETMKCFRLTLYFPLPRGGLSPVSVESWFLEENNGIWKPRFVIVLRAAGYTSWKQRQHLACLTSLEVKHKISYH